MSLIQRIRSFEIHLLKGISPSYNDNVVVISGKDDYQGHNMKKKNCDS